MMDKRQTTEPKLFYTQLNLTPFPVFYRAIKAAAAAQKAEEQTAEI